MVRRIPCTRVLVCVGGGGYRASPRHASTTWEVIHDNQMSTFSTKALGIIQRWSSVREWGEEKENQAN